MMKSQLFKVSFLFFSLLPIISSRPRKRENEEQQYDDLFIRKNTHIGKKLEQVRLPVSLLTPNNKGWSTYLADQTTASLNIPLAWQNKTKIPSWIQGSYVKNGPGRKGFEENQFYRSYRDSWGKLHKFTFNNGSVTFSGKMTMTMNYNRSLNADHLIPSITLDHTEPNQWNEEDMLEMIKNGNDNTNVNVWRLGPANKTLAQYIAVSEFPLVNEVDMETLEVKQRTILPHGAVSEGTSAHWRREVGRNSSINFHIVSNEKGGVNFTLYRYNNTYQEQELIGTFPLPHPSLIHMVSNTPDFAVIVVCPLSLNLMSIKTEKKYPVETVQFYNETTKIFLMNLKDGSVGEPFESKDPSLSFVTHHVNAWEESQYVVVDLVTQPWDSAEQFLQLDKMLHHLETQAVKSNCLIKRVTLNLSTKEVKVNDWPNKQNIPMLNTIDYPIINPAFQGLKNQFVYGLVSMDYWRQVLVKKDLGDSVKDKRWFSKNHYPGELSFVARPGATEEDDGVLITCVFDGEKGKSYLLLMDGKSFTEIDRAYLPAVVPYSFHGNWFPEL